FALPWWPPIGDCLGRPLLDKRGAAQGLDFTARIIFVGPRTFQGKSLWSIARVEQRFSGSGAKVPDVVVLRGLFEPRDDSRLYFVEGRPSGTVFARFLPVIQPTPCGHTAPIDFAAVALRILHDGPPKTGARLVGRVYRYKVAGADLDSRIPVPGVGISIVGPTGSFVSLTDAEGIYDATGLPPGRYTLSEATDAAGSIFPSVVFTVGSGEISGGDFYIR
ncbi:MAG: carboxypeptidase-like regulatory domain-containing protein, partial [Bryobacteraceae bacterium]